MLSEEPIFQTAGPGAEVPRNEDATPDDNAAEPASDIAPPAFACDPAEAHRLRTRRIVAATLVTATATALAAWMGVLLARDGFSLLDGLIVAAFSLTLPWGALNFWNAVIGFAVLRLSRDPLAAIAPFAADPPRGRVTARTAILMTLRNEDTARALARLATIRDGLAATPFADRFDFFVLSDSSHADVIAAEEARFTAWRAGVEAGDPAAAARLHYRRRTDNAGFKAGNIRDFVLRWGARYSFMVTLDADSLMTADAILRLVRIGQARPEIGILQTLVVGLPAETLFARAFQFGMRQGMRIFTAGATWWQGDCGPHWGHNALIRVAPFAAHCGLPVLPGAPPLGGHVLSHDQVEAALMRRAGYAVRVLPVEGGSFEDNPPALPEFMKRDHRWCQGNMQYLRLLGLPGLLPTSRAQLATAIGMYLGSFGWVAFILLGALGLLLPASPSAVPVESSQAGWIWLLVLSLSLAFTPKIAGMADVLMSAEARARYGGGPRFLAGAILELVLMTLFAPVIAVAVAIFMAGLPFGRTVTWDAQQRDGYRLSVAAAARRLWPQTLLGFLLLVEFERLAPGALPYAAPVIAGLLLSVPLTVATASRRVGRATRRLGLCAMPEETGTRGPPPPPVAALAG